MEAQQAKVQAAVLELVTGVTCSTANHYGRPNAVRSHAEIWLTAIDPATGNMYYRTPPPFLVLVFGHFFDFFWEKDQEAWGD